MASFFLKLQLRKPVSLQFWKLARVALIMEIPFPMHVTIGDVVVVDKYAGTEVEVDGQKLLLVHESDILAIVK